ncbi:MAG: DUF4244 domain-containing protein [Micropruina sp.]|nr:DUF4244 domain-containing protein [Micropruina sp.]
MTKKEQKKLVRVRGERGMTTAEYAVGVILVIAVLGALVWAFNDTATREQIAQLVIKIISWIVNAVTAIK